MKRQQSEPKTIVNIAVAEAVILNQPISRNTGCNEVADAHFDYLHASIGGGVSDSFELISLGLDIWAWRTTTNQKILVVH